MRGIPSLARARSAAEVDDEADEGDADGEHGEGHVGEEGERQDHRQRAGHDQRGASFNQEAAKSQVDDAMKKRLANELTS